MFLGEVNRSLDAPIRLASWGRCFWQDPNDGTLIATYASGSTLTFDYSIDSGVNWVNIGTSSIANFTTHDNYDTLMDRDGNLHLLYRTSSNGVYRSVIKNTLASYTVNTAANLPSFTPGDTGNVGGINGSLFMDESGPGVGSVETASNWPLIRIVAKDNQERIRAFYSEPSYTSVSEDSDGVGNTGPHDVAVRDAGVNGGFPIMYRYTDGFNTRGSPAITYFCEPTGTLELITRSYEFNQWTPNGNSISTTLRPVDVPALSGVAAISGLAPPGPMMTFGSGIGTSNIFVGNTQNLQTLYSTQSQLIPGTPFDTLIIEPTPGEYIRTGSDPAPFGSGDRSFAINRVLHGVHGITQTPHVSGSGGYTRCDFSFTDNRDEIKFYFQDLDDTTGLQAIKRVLATQRAGQSGAPPQWQFASKRHPESGIKTIALVNSQFTGGSGIPCWTGFKALRHPTEPGDGTQKREMLLLAGQNPVVPNGSVDGFIPGILSVYDVDSDPVVNGDFPYPRFLLDYTRTSGSPVGLTNVSASGWDNSHNLFDENLSTYSPIVTPLSIGDNLTIEFSKPILVERVEMLKANTAESGFGPVNLPNFTIETSFDGVNFVDYKQDLLFNTNYLSSSLIKTHPILPPAVGPSATSTPTDFTITHNIQPMVGKYFRFTRFGSAAFQGPMRELRLYGPAGTQGNIITGGNKKELLIFSGPLESYRTEKFNVRHGSLPAEFSTYGDFNWFTSASGTWAKAADLPGVIPSSVGLVDTGTWIGQPVGNEDGFAATVPSVSAGAGSGIMQAVITVSPDEYFNGGVFNGRPIQFDYRLDLHTDDEFEFTTIRSASTQPPYGDFVNPVSRMLWVGNTSSYTTSPDYALTPGRYLLQWQYRRGSQTDANTAGAAWIDNVRGLDGQPQPSIRGFLRGGSVGESGVINAYTHGSDLITESINGYVSGLIFSESINGYLLSAGIPGPGAYINGYVNSALAQSINGFLFGNPFTTKTFPTGEIKGYVNAPPGALSTIHGYVETPEASNIYGFLHGYNQETTAIHGYVDSIDFTSTIYGVVNGGATGIIDSINGFVQSRYGIGDQVIYGYVQVPSGFVGNIHGYTQGWEQGPSFYKDPQTMVYGYIPSFTTFTESVHGYASGGYPAGRIKGYLSADFLQVGSGAVNGYVKRPSGNFSNRKGYVSAGVEDAKILGYLSATTLGSGSIHGYINSSFTSRINGYLFAVSGIPSSAIHGYLPATTNIYSMIFGNLIGIQDVSVGADPCPAHNFPLVSVPTVSIPTGNFFN